MTVQDGGQPPRSTSGQLTIIIDNYDVKWHALSPRSVSNFLSLPRGGLQLAIIVASGIAFVLIVALIAVAVVAHRNRNRKYVVNGRGGSGNGGAPLMEGGIANSTATAATMPPPPPSPPQCGVGMLVVDDVSSYDDVICCDENCSECSDVTQVNSVHSTDSVIWLCECFSCYARMD